MTEESQRILLGRIVTAHGIRGDVVVDSYTAEPADIAAYGALQSRDGSRTWNIKVVRVTPRGVIARVAGVSDRNGAEALRGTELYALRSQLPAADEGEFYYADLVGLRVENEVGEVIGSVASVQNYGAGDLLELRLADRSVTELLPFTDAFVPTVDLDGGRVVVIMPAAAEDDDDEDGNAPEG